MESNDITAWATVALAVFTLVLCLATIALAVAALKQIPIIIAQSADSSRRQRESDTLRVCLSFDTDPVIYAASRRVWLAAHNGIYYRNNPRISQHDVFLIANYLDGIAIGARDNFFDENIIWAHLGPIMKKMTDIILPEVIGSTNDFETLVNFVERRR